MNRVCYYWVACGKPSLILLFLSPPAEKVQFRSPPPVQTIANCVAPSSMHCVLGLLFKTSVCGAFGTSEEATQFRWTERY